MGTTNTNQEFDIVVWYRCVRAGEMEKDFQDYKINADNVQEAVNKAADDFKSRKAIPFSFVFVKPNFLFRRIDLKSTPKTTTLLPRADNAFA